MSKLKVVPELVTIGNREFISTGKFNIPLVAFKVLRDGVSRWITVKEIAKTAYGTSYHNDIKRARSHIASLRRHLLLFNNVLITDQKRPVDSVKIYVGGEEERQLAIAMMEKLRNRNELSVNQYEHCMKILTSEKTAE